MIKGKESRRGWQVKRRGQVQMNETTIVLIIFSLILIMGIFLFYQYNMKSIEANKVRYERDKVYTLLSILPNSAFLQKSSFLDEEFAVDTSKLIGLKLDELVPDLGYKRIVIKQVYPNEISGECIFGKYPKCDTYVLYDNEPRKKMSSVVISAPVPLYFPLTDSYKAGKIDITWWS